MGVGEKMIHFLEIIWFIIKIILTLMVSVPIGMIGFAIVSVFITSTVFKVIAIVLLVIVWIAFEELLLELC